MKRRQEGDCVYIVSTDRRPPPTPRVSSTPTLSPRPPTDHTAPPTVYSRLPNTDSVIEAPAKPSNGYLGYTSYCSVYEETETALGVTTNTTTTPDADYSSGRAKAREPSPRILDACLRILNFVPDPESSMANFREFPTTFDGFPHRIARRILTSLYATFGHYLGRDRNPQDLEVVARKLCANTARPFNESEQDIERWIAQFVGENLRWESIGILFTFWDMYRNADGQPRIAYHHKYKFTGRIDATRESLKLCLEVCTEFSSGNTLILYVCQKVSVAESTYSGDASKLFPLVSEFVVCHPAD